MLPDLVPVPGSPWPILPPGLHSADLTEVCARFATNNRRRNLFFSLKSAAESLSGAGCLTLYLDGSYVSGKPIPGDYDACWDPTGVDPTLLDPVFLDFNNNRAAQNAKFQGDFFPSSMICSDVGRSFLDFFQNDRFSGTKKGIVSINLQKDSMIQAQVTP